MTPDAPRPDEADVELWPRAMRTAVASGRDVILPVAAARVPLAEFDRRGAALADAQAEVARLRAALVHAAMGWEHDAGQATHGAGAVYYDCAREVRALAAAPASADPRHQPDRDLPDGACSACEQPHPPDLPECPAPAPAEDGDR